MARKPSRPGTLPPVAPPMSILRNFVDGFGDIYINFHLQVPGIAAPDLTTSNPAPADCLRTNGALPFQLSSACFASVTTAVGVA